jgi:hypothetical protein
MPRVSIPTEFAVALRPAAGKRDLVRLRKLLFSNWLSPFLRKHIKHAPRTSHTNALGTTEHMVEAELAKRLDGDRIVYRLVQTGDDSCDLSRVAAHHWLTLALAALLVERDDLAGWIGAFGYQLAAPRPSLAELLERARPLPLVEVAPRRKVLVGAVPGAPDRIIVDEGVGPQRVAELAADDRKRVAQAAASGVCACFLCAKLRERHGGKAARPKAATAKPACVRSDVPDADTYASVAPTDQVTSPSTSPRRHVATSPRRHVAKLAVARDFLQYVRFEYDGPKGMYSIIDERAPPIGPTSQREPSRSAVRRARRRRQKAARRKHQN